MSKKGITATVIWTQLIDAVLKDFSIELPRNTGKETTKLIREIAKQLSN